MKAVRSPSRLASTRFRSLTDARWAAFFTLLGWPWRYEPFILKGYTPEFVLEFAHPLLVEVRAEMPATDLAGFEARCLEASGWDSEALVLGPMPINVGATNPHVGAHAERELGPDGALSWCWEPARLFHCVRCQRASLLNENRSYRCRRCGADDGNEHLDAIPDGQRLWSVANHFAVELAARSALHSSAMGQPQ